MIIYAWNEVATEAETRLRGDWEATWAGGGDEWRWRFDTDGKMNSHVCVPYVCVCVCVQRIDFENYSNFHNFLII